MLVRNSMNKLLALSLLLFSMRAAATFISKRQVTTFISPHSVSVDAARELAGWENIVNMYTSDNTYSALAITPEATLTFRPDWVTQCLFGQDIVGCGYILGISGSEQSNRRPADWLADYFGLPPDYHSAVYLIPKVMQGLVDINWFVGWDRYLPGLYF